MSVEVRAPEGAGSRWEKKRKNDPVELRKRSGTYMIWGRERWNAFEFLRKGKEGVEMQMGEGYISQILIALAVIVLLLLVVLSGLVGRRRNAGKKGENSGLYVICPNPNCGYRGEGRPCGGTSVILLILLFSLGIVPGILYLLLSGSPEVICPRCGMRIR